MKHNEVGGKMLSSSSYLISYLLSWKTKRAGFRVEHLEVEVIKVKSKCYWCVIRRSHLTVKVRYAFDMILFVDSID